MSSAAEEKTEASGGGNKLVLILTIVNVVVSVGMIGVLFISFKRDNVKPRVGDINAHVEAGAEKPKEGEAKGEGASEKAPEKAKAAEFGRMITLDQFTVNLTSPGASAPRFVRVNVSLEVPDEETESEANAKTPQVRNAIIDLFNSKHPSDLATAEGRDSLKEEIRNALNGFLTRGKVKGVFFTNFVLGS